MQKSKLDKFIQKYNLGGNVNSVKWTADANQLKTSFVTPDKSLLGTVVADNVKFEDADLGVYQTDQLQKLLGVLSDDIMLELVSSGDKAVALKISDADASVNYMLSDLSVINKPPQLKNVPKFELKLKVDSTFIKKFIAGIEVPVILL